MKIIIVGGGKLGNQIARNMLERKYTVKLIEKDKVKCTRLANDLDAEVIFGDGTELDALEEAGAKSADCFIAVTGSDQDNLVASQLAKKEFKIKKVIARNNDPRNLDALRKLGPDIAVSSTEIITNMIEQEVDSAQMHLLATLNKGRASISALKLPEDTALKGVTLRDLTLPNGSLIISIVRNETLIIPNGLTSFLPNDEIVAVCDGSSERTLLKTLGARK
ncbi:Trk system potassium uptake protein TrkA [Caprobacter fermentans]|uniref:Trk system potassium uptake protein TrkA n=1 Tax=Caproicibacter fermentans TaxID=2576756 RepID=A0A6N8I064_9FIRM|nr:TrkA family potassium uptake protein [Caproicibacter fermentans]MVB10953.1 Trk system potassium uptake protein TrkA [Caproicibacter fermentans]OCN01655.1 potassium transporter TrkA [Clostridium sp. W14A]QNK39430.1 TrkA family potassium uptake protein [Caproicibacter fermentans]